MRLAVYTVQSRKTTNKRSDTNKYVISICPIWKFAENLSLLILLLLLSGWVSDAVVFGFCSFHYFCDVKSSPALSVGREWKAPATFRSDRKPFFSLSSVCSVIVCLRGALCWWFFVGSSGNAGGGENDVVVCEFHLRFVRQLSSLSYPAKPWHSIHPFRGSFGSAGLLLVLLVKFPTEVHPVSGRRSVIEVVTFFLHPYTSFNLNGFEPRGGFGCWMGPVGSNLCSRGCVTHRHLVGS